ncbi:MAG: hypothetical protein ACKVGW_08720, partial [Verrucomicrobiia bacterium]
WKYIYSAADDKEWLFDLANDPYEIVNRKDDPSCLSQLQALKDACIQRFKTDGYFKPLDGDDWKHFPPTSPPVPNSDDGQLFQDPDALEKQIKALGIYARSNGFTKDKRYGLLDRLFDASRQTPESLPEPKS